MPSRKTYRLELTAAELTAVRMCISGELENDDGRTGHYFNPLRRVARKLAAAPEANRTPGATREAQHMAAKRHA